jgi:hypothetical protein
MEQDINNYVGKSYTFEDGNKIEIIQVRMVDEQRGGPSVTYFVHQGRGIPQKLIMPMEPFIELYGHLFEDNPQQE